MVNGFVPKDLREALELRAAENVVPYAGGTDLMVENRPGVSYLFIGKLAELRQIREDERCIRIGAAVTYTEALASPLVPPLMKEAVSRIAAPAIRNAIYNATGVAIDTIPITPHVLYAEFSRAGLIRDSWKEEK